MILKKSYDEFSVCMTENVPSNTIEREDGWKGFRIQMKKRCVFLKKWGIRSNRKLCRYKEEIMGDMNQQQERTSDKIVKYTMSLSFLIAIIGGYILSMIFHYGTLELLFGGFLIGLFLVHPVVLSVLNMLFLLQARNNPHIRQKGRQIEWLTIIEGSVYSIFLVSISNITLSNWTETLYNFQIHTPIWSDGMLTIIVIAIIAVSSYLLLSMMNIKKLPPLISVGAISGMYLGMFLCLLWMVQIFSLEPERILLCLLPFNFVVIGIKTIRYAIFEWNMDMPEEEKGFKNQMLNRLNKRLVRSKSWPIVAFLFVWPLLGVIICILMLFGQRPDSIIKAFTETSDWNLSLRQAPQNIYYDEHYLCTVAAGGHEKIVKPVRMGERHGHRVIVNRQLCIANAFEQILEEKMPVVHRYLRKFYDTYGFPVAKLVKSPYIADIIYIIMKPLEWIFLIILYCCDVNPENRIAVQYLPHLH